MKKIPTLFKRGDNGQVTPVVTPGCEWVLDGYGLATWKLDGTACLWHGGQLWKRRELWLGDAAPRGFFVCGHDEETGRTVGWIPVGDGPEDRWHREGLENSGELKPGATYELLGPKVQVNPENHLRHVLVEHGQPLKEEWGTPPRTFLDLRAWLRPLDIEGIVWWGDNGHKAKIKKKDFGMKRRESAP